MRDAERFELSPDDIEAIGAALAGDAPGDGVWPEHAAIVEAFLAASTQWRAVAIGGGMAPGRVFYIGLDYSSVKVALDAARIDISTDLWTGLQIIEAEARDALNGEGD